MSKILPAQIEAAPLVASGALRVPVAAVYPMTRWRQRLGEEHLGALLQESLSVAHKTGALETKDLLAPAPRMNTVFRRNMSPPLELPEARPRL